jgi:hypothetical protein
MSLKHSTLLADYLRKRRRWWRMRRSRKEDIKDRRGKGVK